MLRRIIAVILGMIVCQAVFSVLALTTMQVWPDYASHAHHYLDQRKFTFTSIMACMNLVFWALGFIAAGWMTVRIARESSAIWALAGLMELYVVYAHVVRSWSTFPWWYNIVVVCSVVPAVLLGKLVANKPHGASSTERLGDIKPKKWQLSLTKPPFQRKFATLQSRRSFSIRVKAA